MKNLTIEVQQFEIGTLKEAALKPLEEAAEAFGAYQKLIQCEDTNALNCPHNEYPNIPQKDCQLYIDLADEIADTIQATVNLAYRYDIDINAAMRRCDARNRARGRCS